MTRIICDSSALISMSDNCLLNILRKLKKELVITPGVYNEIITNPESTKKFLFKAVILRKLVEDGTVKVVSHPKLRQEADIILNAANQILKIDRNDVRIIHQGEAECIALYKLIGADAFLVDERTTRHLIEAPEKLRDYMQSRLSRKIDMNLRAVEQSKKIIGRINVIRSSEVLAFAYENGLMNLEENRKTLEAALYALKFSGCSITEEEIQEYLKLLG